MNDLLKMAVEAHGGLSRWNELATVKANVSVTGVSTSCWATIYLAPAVDSSSTDFLYQAGVL